MEELIFQLLLLADARQSAMIRREPERYYERNHLVKKHGNKYFVAAGVGHAAISFVLPERERKVWQYGTIAVQAGYVAHNYRIGLRVSF